MEFKYYLIEQLKKHPSMQAQDVVKMCFQAAFGAEHMLADASEAKRYFDAEFDAAEPRERQLFENLSDGVARVDIGAWKSTGMPKDWLFNMFLGTATLPRGGKDVLEQYLLEAEECLAESSPDFSLDLWRGFLEKYKESGMSAVHHSGEYRRSEKPAYRIVDRRFLRVVDILEKLNCLKKEQGAIVVSIDGRAASGKTTLADILCSVLNAPVVHMDDFFLPPELRTPQRLAEAGGNIHYERFCDQVVPFIGKRESFSYDVFDCGSMSVCGKVLVGESQWRIVEGSYSHHPNFGDCADLKIFCSVSPDEQMKRIIARNGVKLAEMFKSRWIPMEEAYFDAFDICGKADMTV